MATQYVEDKEYFGKKIQNLSIFKNCDAPAPMIITDIDIEIVMRRGKKQIEEAQMQPLTERDQLKYKFLGSGHSL